MNRNQCRAPRQPLRWLAALWLALSVSGAEANLKLSISSAAINKKSGDLTVKGSFAVGKGEAMPQDKLLRFFHGRGGMLDTLTLNANKQKFAFTVTKNVVDYILDADLQKTDLWDIVDRRGETNLARIT